MIGNFSNKSCGRSFSFSDNILRTASNSFSDNLYKSLFLTSLIEAKRIISFIFCNSDIDFTSYNFS